MSRTPVQRPQPARKSGSRSFERRQQRAQRSTARRETLRRHVRRPTDLRAQLRRIPKTAWICALVAVLNATAWSIITPPFQGRDEVDHYAYVEQLAETDTLPHRGEGGYQYSPEEGLVMEGLRYGEVRFAPYMHSVTTDAEQSRLIKDVDAGLAKTGPGEAGGASTEPPLFYVIQTIPYALGGGNMLVQLQLMRLLDALFGGLTALLVFYFVRITVPAVPWAAKVAAICAALQPTFAFVTGSMNPDALVFPLCAATFVCLALAFRRQLTRGLAILLGAIFVAGLVTYDSFIAVAVGGFAGLVILGIRDARAKGRRALINPGIALGIGAAPIVIDFIAHKVSGGSAFGHSIGSALSTESLFNRLSYVWQLFLPRLPGMPHYFAGLTTWRDVWFDRSVGLYGWMDTMFPSWVDNVALVLAGIVFLLLLRALVTLRSEIKARLPELAAYTLILLAVLGELGLASYSSDVIEKELAYGEPRYLLVALPLFAAAIALAIRGAGKRWMTVAGVAMVVLFLGHDLFSQLQVIARYYG
jgi:hypothetical protein